MEEPAPGGLAEGVLIGGLGPPIFGPGPCDGLKKIIKNLNKHTTQSCNIHENAYKLCYCYKIYYFFTRKLERKLQLQLGLLQIPEIIPMSSLSQNL